MHYVRGDRPRDFGVGDRGHLRDLLVAVGAHARNRLGRFFSREVTQRERGVAFPARGVRVAFGAVPGPLGLGDELPGALELGDQGAGGRLDLCGALPLVAASGTQSRHWIVPRVSAIQRRAAGPGSLRYRRTTQ